MALNTGVLGGYNYNHILLAAPTTTLVKTGDGILHTVTINNPAATEVIVIYDGVSAGGTPIASITIPATPVPITLTYDVHFKAGLTIVTQTAASDITVSYI